MDPILIQTITQTIAAVAIFAAVIVGLGYIRTLDQDNTIRKAVHAVEQQYGQLDGPERLAKAEEIILARYPWINRSQMRAGIEAAVLILGLTVDAVNAGQIKVDRTNPEP